MMERIELYNKFLEKKIFEIENPLNSSFPGNPAKVKFRLLGVKDYLSVGKETEYLTYEITLLPSGALNGLINMLFQDKKVKMITTTTTDLYFFRMKSNVELEDYLLIFGEQRPVMCVSIKNEFDKTMNESIIKESKHDTLVSDIVKDILIKLKQFKNSDSVEGTVDLPEEGEYYQTPFIERESFPFFVELYLFKTDSENYKIDADAPINLEENNITIAVYFNPKKLKEQISEIKNNLIYTLRHEYEHLLQTIHDYGNVTYPKTHKFKKDSLKTLLKRQEIEPQLRGYFLQSKKEKKPFDDVIKKHLDKLENNNQISFLGPERKKIVVDILVDYARQIKLPIKLSDEYR